MEIYYLYTKMALFTISILVYALPSVEQIFYSYSKENGRIEHIYYFKNHKLVKSVDFKSNETPHAHYWNNGIVGRKKHDRHNTHELSDRDMRLLNKALRWNNEHRTN